MTLKSRLSMALFGASLIFCLSGCAGFSDPAPSPSPEAAPTNSQTPTPKASPVKGNAETIKVAGEALFKSLPSGQWRYSYTAEGASATMDNVLNIESIKTWAKSLEASGWKFTTTQDKKESFIGYLTKNDKIVTVLAATNPSTAVSTTAVFYYSDAAWTGTSTQS